ncbi:MAG: pyridoxamine 5'-phosphate oxidase [Solirubrobacteraceae bacterium]
MAEHRDYEAPPLDAAAVDPDPMRQFAAWFAAARAALLVEPEAMLLSTAGAHARYVLLRGHDERGFRFFTSYESAKARELGADPAVALTFGWLAMHRSVRVEGTAERLLEAESDAYFAARPRGSRIGAWASPQSRVIADRAELDRRVAAAEARFAGVQDVPRPPHWGGFLVRPETIELWQGRPSRLHDRLRYRRADGAWVVERLAP